MDNNSKLFRNNHNPLNNLQLLYNRKETPSTPLDIRLNHIIPF